jgi:hypothetical protein
VRRALWVLGFGLVLAALRVSPGPAEACCPQPDPTPTKTPRVIRPDPSATPTRTPVPATPTRTATPVCRPGRPCLLTAPSVTAQKQPIAATATKTPTAVAPARVAQAAGVVFVRVVPTQIPNPRLRVVARQIAPPRAGDGGLR